jgi:hypothetical protein
MFDAAGNPCDRSKVRRGNDHCRCRREVETNDLIRLALRCSTIWRTQSADPRGHPADAHPSTTRIRRGWGDCSRSLQTGSSQGRVLADSLWQDHRANLAIDGAVGRAIRRHGRNESEAFLPQDTQRALTHQWSGEKGAFLILLHPGRKLFLLSSPSRTHLPSSLPVTVFAFARENGLLYGSGAPEPAPVETMEDGLSPRSRREMQEPNTVHGF